MPGGLNVYSRYYLFLIDKGIGLKLNILTEDENVILVVNRIFIIAIIIKELIKNHSSCRITNNLQ